MNNNIIVTSRTNLELVLESITHDSRFEAHEALARDTRLRFFVDKHSSCMSGTIFDKADQMYVCTEEQSQLCSPTLHVNLALWLL